MIIDADDLTLGFSRLSIVGARGLVQPIRYGNVVGAINGEIYNYRRLWRDLPDQALGNSEPSSDCEVVPILASHHPDTFVIHLDGIFAGALYFFNPRKLVLFRDHVGVKPLYYIRRRDGLAFASTVSALAPLAGFAVNHAAMRRYLENGYVPGPTTLLRGVTKVPPGTLLRFASNLSTPTSRRWFDLGSVDPACLAVAPTLREAVVSQMPQSGPVACTLSGGIDSTLVTLLAQQAGADPIALTVAYPDHPDDPDLAAARRVCTVFGLRHELVWVGANDYWLAIEGDWRFDQPLADPNALALHLLCRRVSAIGSRVLLTGDGSDELFCGYPYYRLAARRPPWRYLAAWTFTSMADARDRSFARYVCRRPIPRRVRPTLTDPLRAIQKDDITGWLEANLLEKSDRFGMASQVEIRVPFLTADMVRLALNLPMAEKVDVQGGPGKVALRAAFADLLPSFVAQRPKAGFPCPIGAWLRGPLGEALQADATWSVSGAWDVRREQHLWRQHRTGQSDWGQQLWRCAVARSWWRSLHKAPPKITIHASGGPRDRSAP